MFGSTYIKASHKMIQALFINVQPISTVKDLSILFYKHNFKIGLNDFVICLTGEHIHYCIFSVIPDESTMSITGLDKDYELRHSEKIQIRCSAGCSFPNVSFVFQYVVSLCLK